MKLRLILLLTALCSSAYAESWQCRNDLEVRCADGKCETQKPDGFTPMSVSFNDSGTISVCAYSGCWEGTGKVFNSGKFLMLTGSNLRFSTAPSPSKTGKDISITLDRNDNVANLKAGEFAHPLICKKSAGKLPAFADYRVRISKARPKPIRFGNNRDARMFRTRLREAHRGGVNFAGHFIFTSWGCGTGCQMGAIITTRMGVVYFPKELAGIGFGVDGAPVSDDPMQYRKSSKLFILDGYAGNGKANGVTYLIWQGNQFKQVRFDRRKK
jgi:hypothetical protein